MAIESFGHGEHRAAVCEALVCRAGRIVHCAIRCAVEGAARRREPDSTGNAARSSEPAGRSYLGAPTCASTEEAALWSAGTWSATWVLEPRR
jgi:hypothetical protein